MSLYVLEGESRFSLFFQRTTFYSLHISITSIFPTYVHERWVGGGAAFPYLQITMLAFGFLRLI